MQHDPERYDPIMWGVDADGIRRSPTGIPEVDEALPRFYFRVGAFILALSFVVALVTGEWAWATVETVAMTVAVVAGLLFMAALVLGMVVGLLWTIGRVIVCGVWSLLGRGRSSRC